MYTLARSLVIAALLPLAAQAALESWTGPDGAPVQAEFIRRSTDYVTLQRANGTRYLLPYAKLTESERTRIDILTGHTAAAPTPATTTTADTVSAPPTPPPIVTAEPAQTVTGKVLSPLISKLVYLKGSTLMPYPSAQLTPIRYLAVYYSAHWCPPCRAFTPKLVEAYKKIKAAHPEFELVFVSSDEDEDSMKTYMKETGMAWPAVRFDQKGSIRSLQRPSQERGIPNLVFMTADGKELATSFTAEGDYSGPYEVLATIQRQFKM